MARQLFGTDGIRGVAGEPPLDASTVFAFGMALGDWALEVARSQGIGPVVIIGMDTRESGPWLAETVAAGLHRRGAAARFAGLTTTPGVAYLTRTEDSVAGIMISASHNPYHDNGLKVFDHSGFKLPDAQEHRLEERIFDYLKRGVEPARLPLSPDERLDRLYLDYLVSTFHGDLGGMRIVVDCANGAATHLAPELFQRLGAAVIPIHCHPDGRNINLNCGALHTDALRRAVREHNAACGAAFDGDADRCMMISSSGKLIDGDHVLLIMAKRLMEQPGWNGSNGGPAVVATVMSNLGLEKALEKIGVRLERTQVGDKYVLERMVEAGLPVGGEQSGHVIFRDYATTGDGLLTAIRVLDEVRRTGRTLDELTGEFFVYPQKLVNVKFKVKKPLESLPGVQAEIAAVKSELGDRGRVLVRFSGTEPLARVMVEGPDMPAVDSGTSRIASAIEAELG